jgi:hypothetical protein
MLGVEARDAGAAGRLREFIERSVSLAQGDDLLLGPGRGKKFAEAPDAAEIEGRVGGAAVAPGRL